MKRQKILFPLLSLPWLPLMTVMKSLDRKDRNAAAGTCRSLASVVNAASQDTKLTVRPTTGWEGLRQIIVSNTITCKVLELHGNMSVEDQPSDSALGILLAPSILQQISLPNVHEVVLNVHPLPCLLPPNLATILPNLKELTLIIDNETYANLQPLPYCSSLNAISLFCRLPDTQRLLPSKYHSCHDLKRQLPNVTSLCTYHQDWELGISPCISTMLQAWGNQLTSLQLDISVAALQLQQCTQLQSLELFQNCVPLAGLPTSLTSLVLYDAASESDLEHILQLPALNTFACSSFTDCLQQDWSQHPCAWRYLRFGTLGLTDIAKLPLRSLTGHGCLHIECVKLPDPLAPDSLLDVRHAAQRVSQAGIAIEGFEYWKYTMQHGGIEADKASAALLFAAGKAIQPPRSWTCQWVLDSKAGRRSVSNHRHSLAAILCWSSNTLSSIEFTHSYAGLPNWLWRELQCCSALRIVKVNLFRPLAKCICESLNQAILASEYFVAVTRRPLVLEVRCRSNSEDEFLEAALTLRKRLVKELPSSVTLADVTRLTTEFLRIYLQPATTTQIVMASNAI